MQWHYGVYHHNTYLLKFIFKRVKQTVLNHISYGIIIKDKGRKITFINADINV